MCAHCRSFITSNNQIRNLLRLCATKPLRPLIISQTYKGSLNTLNMGSEATLSSSSISSLSQFLLQGSGSLVHQSMNAVVYGRLSSQKNMWLNMYKNDSSLCLHCYFFPFLPFFLPLGDFPLALDGEYFGSVLGLFWFCRFKKWVSKFLPPCGGNHAC